MYIFKVKELRLNYHAADILSHARYKEMEAFCKRAIENQYFPMAVDVSYTIARATLIFEIKRELLLRHITPEQFKCFEVDFYWTQAEDRLFYDPCKTDNYNELGE